VLRIFRGAGLTTLLAAPTGRAAKRLAEATGAPALTLHRLLEFDPRLRKFQRDREKPIDAQAIVVDEASMLDLPLAAALLQAVPDPARVVIVGDVDHLPSVGPGAVLRDLIDSGVVRVVRLEHVFRQGDGSLIIQNAHAILAGNPPSAPGADVPNADFFVIARKDAEQAAQTVEQLVTEPRNGGNNLSLPGRCTFLGSCKVFINRLSAKSGHRGYRKSQDRQLWMCKTKGWRWRPGRLKTSCYDTRRYRRIAHTTMDQQT
jgi:hypothetical protein